MTFSWLPDAALDPHPRLSWLIECGFDLTIAALYRKEEILPPDYRSVPGTLIVSNHQRDSDVPILTTVLCQREGLHIRWPLPFYAMREDLLSPGGLANLLAGWPRPLAELIGHIPLASFFRRVRGQPMRRLREFSLGETLNALLDAGYANAEPATIFNARGRREIAAMLGKLPSRLADIDVRRLGRLRYSMWGLRRLRGTALRTLGPAFRATIAAQLERFAALLDAGRTVYFAPEGTISDSGEFGRIRAGAWRLVRLTATPPPILPLVLSYDPLGPGRLRVIVQVGAPLREYDRQDARRFRVGLEREIRRHYPVNTSHLISRYLSRGPERFAGEELTQWVARAAAALAAAGLAIDPLLRRRASAPLVDERLRWLARKGLVVRDAKGWRKCLPSNAQAGWHNPARIVRYLDNAFADHLSALAPELARNLGP